MTDFCIGCDNIDGKESSYINKMAKVFQDAGHNVEKLGVSPNVVQSKGNSGSSKGKVGVYIVGGSDLGTYVDFKTGLERGYYHYKYVWFAFASWTASSWITCSDLKSRGLVRAHDDNFSSQSSIQPYIGKSADYFFQQNKGKMNYVCGNSPEELAKKILNNGGGDSSSETSNVGTIKDALREVQSGWDGYVECFAKGDTFYVRKIKIPSTATLTLVEDKDVFLGSIRVTDYNPSYPNHLTGNWNGASFTIQDEKLIKRFGKVTQELETSDVNICKTLEEFATLEWWKLKRENGHKVECEVRGDAKWEQAKWVYVYLPSFGIEDFMYISKVSHHDENGDWVSQLVLLDYPPSLGKPEDYEKEDETEEEAEEDMSED